MRHAVLCILAVGVMLAGCEKKAQPVRAPAKGRRIVPFSPALTAIAFDMGLGPNVVGVTRFSQLPDGVHRKQVGDAFNINAGLILSVQPDVIFAQTDEGKFQGGDDILNPPKMFIGAAANPFADPFELRVARLAKKVKAGVDFIQTQCIYNLDKFETWMEGVRDRGLHEQVYILAGITPMKSAGMAKYMKNRVPGMDVPDEVVKRLSGVPKEKQAEEGIQMAVEDMQRLKEVKGVSGFHIMAIEWEQKVAEIVERAGLLPRPEV